LGQTAAPSDPRDEVEPSVIKIQPKTPGRPRAAKAGEKNSKVEKSRESKTSKTKKHRRTTAGQSPAGKG
jgi:hypothetical protein